MKIYGVALLALCYLTGKYLGTLLGQALGLQSDVGGVGFAMLFLMIGQAVGTRFAWFNAETKSGIYFWSSIYIPVVVAMAASSNVQGALSGGLGAVMIGLIVTLSAFFLVPLLSKLGK
ncbi:MAG: malonate transporter subunit MadL [Spirosomataceae bacterium]